MLLTQRTIVLVDPDMEGAAILAAELRRAGGRCFVAGSAAMAEWAVRETLPDALVAELRLPDGDAHELLEELRRAPECSAMSSLGITSERSLAAAGYSRGPGFDKYLLKPTPAPDVAEAVCSAIGLRRALTANVHVSFDGIPDLIERAEYGLLLRTLNAESPYRYSAYLRPRGAALHSVWTFDRERPRLDRWPLELGVDVTPCAAVLAARAPVAIEGGEEDPRAASTRASTPMRAFVGVPLLDDAEHVVGVLCHFSPHAVRPSAGVLDRLEWTARLLTFLRRRARSSWAPLGD